MQPQEVSTDNTERIMTVFLLHKSLNELSILFSASSRCICSQTHIKSSVVMLYAMNVLIIL